jgi:hypothetical protein
LFTAGLELKLKQSLKLADYGEQSLSKYSRLSIIRAWFNRFAAQPRQCIFKEKMLFSVSITFV